MWSEAQLLAALVCAAAAVSEPGRAVVAGGVRFGALFAVHGAPVAAQAGSRCGLIREHYGIQRVEATLQALDAINASRRLLRGVVLGAELRDSCWAPPTALREAIDLVRDAITPHHRAPTADCKQAVSGGVPLLGVLGPGASSASVQVQNLLQLFSIPQVSYSATARELSDRARFSTFYRVVPSDLHQARVLVALLRAHNWTYVHAIHTDESYGQSGMAAFREEAAAGGVCVAREEALRAAPAPAEVDAALARLGAAGPHVALCWCEGRTARAVLAGLARRPRPLRLLASDGWADRGDVVAGLEHAANQALTLRIRSPYLTHFDTYYHKLKPSTNHRNPWFKEFWEQKFNCTLAENVPEIIRRRCSGNESLSAGYTQESKLALVVRGVYAFAHALHDMHAALCPAAAAGRELSPRAGGLCDAMIPFNVSLYKHFLSKVRFRAPDGGLVAFDQNGDPLPELSEYDVMSFVGSAERGWRYTRVGRWRGGALSLRGGLQTAIKRAEGVHGVCSAECGVGEWQRAGEGRARCCWTCVPCGALEVVRPQRAGCRLCPPGHKPDNTRTVCLSSPIEWGGGGRGAHWARAVAGGAGGIGLLTVAICGGAFWRHRSTPVVKSASRELCALLLGAAAACHAAALAAAVRPHVASCATVRLAAPALGAVYAAVLARTVRIARLVAAAERRPGARPRLLSSSAQVWLWFGMSSPGAAAAVWSVTVWPPAPQLLHPTRARALLVCGGDNPIAQMVPLCPALILLASCIALAVRTRRLPHNFNETRFIGAAAYTTCVTWIAFFPLYVASEARTLTLCACVSLCACTCVLLSLGPRVFVCVFRPHRNTRQHFLTATSIRCHLGKYRPGFEKDTSYVSPKKELRDTECQTTECVHTPEDHLHPQIDEDHSECGAAECVPRSASWCSSAGACARVTSHSRCGSDSLDVVITLLHHYHAPPPTLTHLQNI